MPEAIYLTPEQLVARWCNRISLQTLANWRSKGKGPQPTKIGSKVLYAIAAVEKYERAQPRTVKAK